MHGIPGIPGTESRESPGQSRNYPGDSLGPAAVESELTEVAGVPKIAAMPRMARVVIEHLPHHVTQRGNRRAGIFFSEEDRRRYLRLFRHYSQRYALRALAFCLMHNHVHWVVIPDREPALAETFRDAHAKYAEGLNHTTGKPGHLFQGRFFSTPLDDEHLWAAVRYVQRNPVRAGMVARAEDYPWSSAAAHCGLHDDPLLAPDFPPHGVINDWREWLRVEDEQQSRAIRCQTFTGRPCGSEGFVRSLEVLTGRILRPQKPGPKPRAPAPGAGGALCIKLSPINAALSRRFGVAVRIEDEAGLRGQVGEPTVKKRYVCVTLALAALALGGSLAYTWRCRTVEQPYQEQPLDKRGVEEWREGCIEQAKNANQWLKKLIHARTAVECAACLDADAKFVRLHANLYWVPVELSKSYNSAEITNDVAQRHELKLRIQEYAKRPEATEEWNKLGSQVTIVRIDDHIYDKQPPGYDEVNAFETVEILWGYIEATSEAWEPDKYKCWDLQPFQSKDRYWDLAFDHFVQMFDFQLIWQSDPNSTFGRLQSIKSYAEVKGLIVPFREWLFRNLRYCYFHPKEKTLKLDLDARARGIPSKEYRKSHPWGSNEGPNKTDPKKVPGANDDW